MFSPSKAKLHISSKGFSLVLNPFSLWSNHNGSANHQLSRLVQLERWPISRDQNTQQEQTSCFTVDESKACVKQEKKQRWPLTSTVAVPGLVFLLLFVCLFVFFTTLKLWDVRGVTWTKEVYKVEEPMAWRSIITETHKLYIFNKTTKHCIFHSPWFVWLDVKMRRQNFNWNLRVQQWAQKTQCSDFGCKLNILPWFLDKVASKDLHWKTGHFLTFNATVNYSKHIYKFKKNYQALN